MSITATIEFKKDYLNNDLNLDEVLQNVEIPECSYYATKLRQYYYDNNQLNLANAKYAQLLMVLCEFRFKEKNGIMATLEPSMIYGVDIVEDIDIEIIEELIEKISNHELLARIYDVLWSTKKDYRLVPKILESYFESIKLLVNYPYWMYPIEEFKRYIYIEKITNNRKDETTCIEFLIEQAENNQQQKNTFFAVNLAECLSDNGLIEPFYQQLLQICEQQASDLQTQMDLFKAASYYNTLAKICHDAQDYDNEKKYTEMYAKTQILEGDKAIQEEGSFFKASHFYAIATECYKKICDDNKYNELFLKLHEYQKKGMSEFITTSYSIDVSDAVNQYNDLFQKLNFYDSVILFSKMFRSPPQEQIDKYIEGQKQYVFKNLFPGAKVNDQGKVVALGHSELNDKEKYKKQMAYEYLMYHWSTACNTIIHVFLRHISLIPFGVKDIQNLVIYNPLVESGREELFINGLYEGLCYNFSTAIHLLIPQIETIFRTILITNGKTATKIVEGIQEEMDLNDMLTRKSYRSILEQTFGKEMVLDLEALLVGRMGMNLRNKLAHGLLSYQESRSAPAVYSFCMVLKIITLGWIHQNRQGA